MARRLGISVDPAQVAACVGTEELVAGVPQWLKLRRPDRDTVLYPAISYPTYAMGATLAGCRAVPFLDLDEIAERSEEHTSELQSLMRTSYAVFCLKKKTQYTITL